MSETTTPKPKSDADRALEYLLTNPAAADRFELRPLDALALREGRADNAAAADAELAETADAGDDLQRRKPVGPLLLHTPVTNGTASEYAAVDTLLAHGWRRHPTDDALLVPPDGFELPERLREPQRAPDEPEPGQRWGETRQQAAERHAAEATGQTFTVAGDDAASDDESDQDGDGDPKTRTTARKSASARQTAAAPASKPKPGDE
jgi:hypothetical protein